jgi:hypothetical protein
MAASPGKIKIWFALIGSSLGIALATWLRYSYLVSHGKPFFWLAELFAPFSVLAVLLVIFVEKLSSPSPKGTAPRKARKKAAA